MRLRIGTFHQTNYPWGDRQHDYDDNPELDYLSGYHAYFGQCSHVKIDYTMTRTRFAPSPTGYLHIGNLRTAIYAYAMAKHAGGDFILRIEDTDQERLVPEGVADIKNILTVFGLAWDEFYVQSERKAAGLYQAAAKRLVSDGHAFYCQCAAKNAKQEGFSSQLRDPCRDQGLTSGAVKLKVPAGETVSYHDFVLRKDVSWDTDAVYDATLLKSDGFPTYHLAAMTDDLAMHVTHVLRGHDWLPSTPIHLLVFKYLGGDRPEIGHLSDIQSSKGGKLSKRRDAVFVEQFLQDGFLPEALLNFVILLGWAPKDNRELFTLPEFVAAFDPGGFQKSNPLYSDKKLNWFNGHYIRQKTDTELTQLVKPFVKTDISLDKLTQIIAIAKERMAKLSDIDGIIKQAVVAPVSYDKALFTSDALVCLQSVLQVVKLSPFTDPDRVNEEFKQEIDRLRLKTGDFYMNLRVALTNSRFTPPITELGTAVIGKSETLHRIENALEYLKS